MSERVLYDRLIITGFISAATVFAALFFVVAPYGRHIRKGWGPTINNTAGWVIMETPAVLIVPFCFMFGSKPLTGVTLFFVLLWECHYIQRAYIFPFRIRNRAKRMPIVIMALAIGFNLFNGYLNGRYLSHFAAAYPAEWAADPRFLVGVCLFFTGYTINLHADHVLFTMRKHGESGYCVPQGGFYRWLSCPNYFGEILEWAGWAVATWSLPGLVFAVWTAANLIPRAWANHRWYREHFTNYPSERRAVIPFLF